MAVADSNLFSITISDAWTPPYDLPMSAGEVVKIGTNRPVDVTSPDWGTYFTDFNMRSSYGAGTVNPEWSAGGAYVYAGNGGHAHPDMAGAMLFDYADATWYRYEHGHPGSQYGDNTGTKGFTLSVMNGSPHYEITDTIFTEGDVTYAVPGPVHPYGTLVHLPASLGGGDRGGVMYVTRATMGETGQTHSGSIHNLDLDTMLWRRFNTAQHPDESDNRYNGSVVYDAARGRYWLWQEDQHERQYLSYLRTSDWTWQTTTPDYDFISENLSAAGNIWMYETNLYVQGVSGTFYGFNPDDVENGWNSITVTGGPLPNRFDRFVYYPPTGKFYAHNGQTTNTTLYRLTPPGSNPLTTAWTLDTITLDTALPLVHADADMAWTILHYVPSIQRLSWLGAVNETAPSVYLIKPE
jgi:hypothetical protein